MDVDRQKTFEVAATAFMGHGITETSAYLTSEVLVSADARDKHSHGLLRLFTIIRGIEHGHVDPDGEITIVTEHRGVAALSGETHRLPSRLLTVSYHRCGTIPDHFDVLFGAIRMVLDHHYT